ncbi:TetR/AcrR family transcriptional regulator C-terminal domain-containing protein [Asanoa sp. NPDC049573]|uniref:TetR/AcrR family transcriptional regulator C-terminal domain-containing protein n=1 Tax=Asanoa sp. NPDC049573 TaxID=3155396 RepID=UPI0034337FD9
MPDPFERSVWTRPARPRSGTPALSRDQIVKAALELLDAEGIDGLSMRRLGAKLGSGATSIYWHVANKDDLLDLAIDAVMGEVRIPDPVDDWRAAAGAMARDLREVLLRHSWIASLFGVRPNVGPNSMALAESMITLLDRAGFSQAEATYAASALSSHAIGAAITAAAWHTAVARSGMTEADLTKSVAAFLEEQREAYPRLDGGPGAPPLDIRALQETTFEYGLERLLDGLAARL